MGDSGSRDSDPNDGKSLYCRKEKSLGVLCTKFLKLYNKEGVDLIGLDDAANNLGVERRRIYDVVNILESIGIVARKQKNQYSWKGFEAIPQALKKLKDEGFKEHGLDFCSSLKESREDVNRGVSTAKSDGPESSSTSIKPENRKEKSLWLLTQNFVKLFLCTDMDMVTLENAAKLLLGDESQQTTVMRTKVRRLYDIANVFSSMNLIEKTHTDSRKPAYRWLGWRRPNSGQYVTGLKLKEGNKRDFGTDITNMTNVKRRKTDPLSLDLNSQPKENVPLGIDLRENCDENTVNQQSLSTSKKFVFGPFAPPTLPATSHNGSKRTNTIKDLEDLASVHPPRYHNQGDSGHCNLEKQL